MIYIACFLASTLMAYLASRSKNRGVIILCSVLSILIPCVLGGLRHNDIGTDTMHYAYPDSQAAARADDFYSFFEARRQELGYSALYYIVMNTLGHPNWCYFAYQLVTISCVYIALYKHRKKIYFPFALILWFFLFYNDTYNMMRQCMAASIVFMGFDSLEARRYVKFMLYFAVACLFHKSALLALPLVLGIYIVLTSDIVHRNAGLKFLVFYGSAIGLFLTRPILLFVINFVPFLSKYSFYFAAGSQYSEVKVTVLLFAIKIGEFVMMTLYSKGTSLVLSGEEANKNDADYYRFNVLFCAIYQFAVRFYTGRILLYSLYVDVIALATLPSFVREKYLKFIVNVAVLLVAAFYWYWVYVKGKAAATWPYKLI